MAEGLTAVLDTSVIQPLKSRLVLLQWVLLLAALGFFTITEEFNNRVIAGLLFLAGFFIIRVVSGNLWPRFTGLEAPLALFVISASVATWISFDFSASLLQFARILAAVGLYSSIADSNPILQRWLAAGFLMAATGLGIYWPLQHDFSSSPAKFQVINILGGWINNNLPKIIFVSLTGPFIHPNVAAGTLALAVPFGVAFVHNEWYGRRKALSILAGFATIVVVIGLLLTSSRGTWAGLALATVGLVFAWIQRRWFATRVKKIRFWGVILITSLVVLIATMTLGEMNRIVGTISGPSGTVQSRMDLWGQGWGLVGDYFFTGSGLGSFWMVHALYVIMIHVPFIAHAHNTILEVWIEQGFLGALALVWGSIILLKWYWRSLDRQQIPSLGIAGLIGLASMAIHGFIDVVFYIERTLPLVGYALGFAWLAVPQNLNIIPVENRNIRSKTILLVGGMSLLVILGVLFNKPLLSLMYANLGALSQTRAELSLYDPDRYSQLSIDQVRRSVDYTNILLDFEKSLSIDPTNRTALQRLSLLALSRGEYSVAWTYMQTAWDANYRDDTTRLLYGDAAVANGFPDEAARALRGTSWGEIRLMSQAWSRYWTQGDYQRALDAWRAVLLLNPLNKEAQRRAAEAEKKLSP